MTEVRVTDPKTGGQKGAKPERFSLVPWEAMAYVARVYAFGAKKYADHNWRRGYAWSLSFDALWRHVAAAQSGEWLDAESGLPHLAHAVFHCLTLIVFMSLGLGTDDRACANEPIPYKPTEPVKPVVLQRSGPTCPDIFEFPEKWPNDHGNCGAV